MTSVSRTVTQVIDCMEEIEGLEAKVYKGINNKKVGLSLGSENLVFSTPQFS